MPSNGKMDKLWCRTCKYSCASHTDTKGYSTELQLRALAWMKLKKRSNETMEVIELLQAPTSHKLFRATYLENREIYKNSMT